MQTEQDFIPPAGSLCDLVTPFVAGRIDEGAIQRLVAWQIASGTAGIAVCAQAGEPTALTAEERARVIRAAVRAADGRVPVLAGTGTNATNTTIGLTRNAGALGAAAAVVTVPYYSKPSPAGIVEHFRRLDAATEIPILVWNAPGQTAVDLSIDTLARLAELPSVAGLVDASGQIGKIAAIPADLRSRLHLYSGHDATALPYCLAGGRGALSVAANVVPRDLCALHDALAAKDVACASDIHSRLMPFLTLLEADPVPVGVKHALHIMFDIPPEVRLPLLEAEAGQRVALAAHVSASPSLGAARRSRGRS